MMKFPWQRRADEEQQHRIQAEARLRQTQGEWPDILIQAERMREQKNLNNWTSIAAAIFSAHNHPRRARP